MNKQQLEEAKKIFDGWVLTFDIHNGCGERPDFDSLIHSYQFFIKQYEKRKNN